MLSLPSNQLLSYRLVCLPELRAMTDLIKTVDLRVDQLCEATNALSPMRLFVVDLFRNIGIKCLRYFNSSRTMLLDQLRCDFQRI